MEFYVANVNNTGSHTLSTEHVISMYCKVCPMMVFFFKDLLLRKSGKYIQKGKSVPLQAWSGPEGSRKLRFPDFMTTVQGGGKVVSLTHRPHLPPGNSPGTHFC